MTLTLKVTLLSCQPEEICNKTRWFVLESEKGLSLYVPWMSKLLWSLSFWTRGRDCLKRVWWKGREGVWPWWSGHIFSCGYSLCVQKTGVDVVTSSCSVCVLLSLLGLARLTAVLSEFQSTRCNSSLILLKPWLYLTSTYKRPNSPGYHDQRAARCPPPRTPGGA